MIQQSLFEDLAKLLNKRKKLKQLNSVKSTNCCWVIYVELLSLFSFY